MTVIHWLLGWILTGCMIGFGILHGWWFVLWLGVVFGILWWYAPDWINHAPKDQQ